MAKITFGIETNTEEKDEMKALLNLMMALNGMSYVPPVTSHPIEKPVKVETKKTIDAPIIDVKRVIEPEVKEEIKETVIEFKTLPEDSTVNGHNPDNPELEEIETEEQKKERIKEEKNARRREAYKKAQEEKDAEMTTTTDEDAANEPEPIADLAEVSPVVSDSQPTVDLTEASPVVSDAQRKIDLQNEVRAKMSERAEHGYREKIKKFLTENGIKGIASMTQDQLVIVLAYLKTLE